MAAPPPAGAPASRRPTPIATPVMVSCWSDRLMPTVAQRLARYGMVPVQAGGGEAPPAAWA